MVRDGRSAAAVADRGWHDPVEVECHRDSNGTCIAFLVMCNGRYHRWPQGATAWVGELGSISNPKWVLVGISNQLATEKVVVMYRRQHIPVPKIRLVVLELTVIGALKIR